LKFIKLSKDENVSEYEIASKLVNDLLKFQYEHMTDEWINEYIPWKYITFISKKITDEIYKSLDVVEKNTGDGKTVEKK
jgi:hypothetical protein